MMPVPAPGGPKTIYIDTTPELNWININDGLIKEE